MSNEIEDALMTRAAQLQNAGQEKFGAETWDAMVSAVSRAGVPGDAVKRIVAGGDAMPEFVALSQECMLRQLEASDNPNNSQTRALEQRYAAVRQVQKTERAGVRGRRS